MFWLWAACSLSTDSDVIDESGSETPTSSPSRDATTTTGTTGTSGTTGTTGDSTAPPIPPPVFGTAVEASALTVVLQPGAADAAASAEVLTAALAVLVDEPHVLDMLNALKIRLAGVKVTDQGCWSTPAFPRFSFTVDFAGCSGQGMSGAVEVAQDPAGVLTLDFDSFVMGTRSVWGTLALVPDGDRASIYATTTDSPLVQSTITVGLGKTELTVDPDLRLEFDAVTGEAQVWGTVAEGTPASSADVGGNDATVLQSVSTPVDALHASVWNACRCPASGVVSFPGDVVVSALSFDLDALEVAPDAVDDPVVTLTDLDPVPSRLQQTHAGCADGTLATLELLTAEVPVAALVAGIAASCDPKVSRCGDLSKAASALTKPLVIDLPAALVDAAGSPWTVDPWCALP